MADKQVSFEMELPELGGHHPRDPHALGVPLKALQDKGDTIMGALPSQGGAIPAAGSSGLSGLSQDALALEREGLGDERVGWVGPAVLKFDGYEETFDVQLLNLSVHGVSCRGPQGLAVGDRLGLQFRLGLGHEVQRFPCKVAWVHAQPDGTSTYGLQFVDIDDALLDQVRSAVKERMATHPNSDAPSLRALARSAASVRMRLLLTGAVAGGLGMMVGAGLVWMFLAASEGSSSKDAVLPVFAAPTEPYPVAKDPPSNAVPSEETPPPDAYVLAPSKSPQPQVFGKAPVSDRSDGAALQVEGDDRQAVMALVTDGPIGSHQAFWLTHPKRLVVDIPGRRNGFKLKTYQVTHPWVHRVRVGQHADKVRFVIEMSQDVAPEVGLKPQGNALRLELRRTLS